ncbi:hypothetical protein BDV27DRAFT_92697 [Aspergillus caelatus]|uniref:Uncharacterized protein n=1 Tax=Aspergillus caelatus TaxID=61420 RepID=A0A5N7A945_9EURO|nr:uncharacterized protein BDV27DRAFT_92697 [Aspergillus caelatus]KAE8366391.1 hypothetical protein BDV27DRAFT_92697 [Aspergillus caelatus]
MDRQYSIFPLIFYVSLYLLFFLVEPYRCPTLENWCQEVDPLWPIAIFVKIRDNPSRRECSKAEPVLILPDEY